MKIRLTIALIALFAATVASAGIAVEPAPAPAPDVRTSDVTEQAPIPQLEAVSYEIPAIAVSCSDAPALDVEAATPEEETTTNARGGKGCKPCKKDRRWCECTLDGAPRISCDPCCYQATPFSTPVCLD